MVFSSLLFIFAFLTPSLFIYTLVQDKHKNTVLLVSSLIFYAWSAPKYLILLLVDTFISWFFALCIQNRKRNKKLYLIIDCVLTLGLLAYFKYTTFFLSNIQAIFSVPKVIPEIVLPIGISFYTFQLLSYVVDVYRKQVVAQPKYSKLLLYSSLFHQCIAGPIVRYETVVGEIDHRTVTQNDLYVGIRRFCVGLAKKAILANGCAQACDALITVTNVSTTSSTSIWLGMVFFMLQIYLDFSAYSDMAIGMGRMVGFHYLENFNYPYMAVSVQDFWRRWHISLSTFFRDYVYIPLGGSRVSKGKTIRNLAIVWFLTGMWHGASWNYILWGLYYLLFLLFERYIHTKPFRPIVQRIYTLIVIYIGWMIFKFEDISQLGSAFIGLFGLGNRSFYSLETKTIFLQYVFFLIMAIVACTSLGTNLRKFFYHFGKQNSVAYSIYVASEYLVPPLLFVLSVLALIGNTYNPFLYFQF